MPISSDVNVIFAYVDDRDIFHVPVLLFIAPSKRKDIYILLDEVKTSFIYTYSNFLKESCGLIEKAIIDYKANRPKLKYKPSPFLINTMVNLKIKRNLEEMAKKKNFKYDTVNRFIKELLREYSIVSLYENSEKISEFREKYLNKAEEKADKAITLFLNKFKRFEIVNFSDVQSFDEWLNKLKKVKLRIFENKGDHEDMRIAAQYLGYNQEKRKLSFITCDKEFHRSLGVVSKHFNQEIGKITLLKPYPKKSS